MVAGGDDAGACLCFLLCWFLVGFFIFLANINRTDTPAVLIKHLTPGDPSNATVYHASGTYDHLD
jgi:hypothetical protein